MAPEQVALPLLQGEETVQGQLQLAVNPPVVQGEANTTTSLAFTAG